MPIKIPNELPATKVLNDENIFVITETRALTQDIRPLQLLILNLMPTKIVTETQLVRLLGNTPLQVEVELLKTSTHKSKNTSEEHMLTFYKTFDALKAETTDIINREVTRLENEVNQAITELENDFNQLLSDVTARIRQMEYELNQAIINLNNLFDANNRYMMQWVENRLQEFIDSLPEILTVMVYNPVQGEVTDIQQAVNDLYTVACYVARTAEQYDSLHVYNFMKSAPAYVYVDEKMDSVMNKFEKTQAWNLPVVERDRNPVPLWRWSLPAPSVTVPSTTPPKPAVTSWPLKVFRSKPSNARTKTIPSRFIMLPMPPMWW